MPELTRRTVLHAPSLTFVPRDGWTVCVDAEAPNWVSADERGTWILRAVAGSPCDFASLLERYAQRWGMDHAKAWVHVQGCVSEALRHGILSLSPTAARPYRGRSAHLRLGRMRECWLHTNNSCNLTCGHCLVRSSPRGEAGLSSDAWRSLIDQALAMGVDRFYITGGEPFVRSDMPELVRYITEAKRTELILLTNATLLAGSRAARLEGLNPELVKFQVSLDGATPQVNDPIRGAGSFRATVEGLRELTRRGFAVTVTTVATPANLEELPALTRLARDCGVRSQHLMWIHRRGRAATAPRHFRSDHHRGDREVPDAMASGLGSEDGAASVGRAADRSWVPGNGELIKAVRAVKQEADRLGVVLDNAASFELRANAPRGTKFDLGNAGWQSLCVYADGHVYPSAATANHPPLDCGDATNGTHLERIWRGSPILQHIREASVVRKPHLAQDPFRYLTGGGDVEHSYFFSGDFLGPDPYEPLYRTLLLDAMDGLTARKIALVNPCCGYDVPRIFHAMGDGAIVCGTSELTLDEQEIAFLHSNCVLSFDVERPRKIVEAFYGEAAATPQAALCCPTTYDPADVAHIPREVLDRFYGCGSPVEAAGVQPGEVYVDLGSGAGIDCFIAAKRVGRQGRVIGVDMTEPMLLIARESRRHVAQALGYEVVEFRHGFLEAIPVEDKTADVVTSNCVVNLSPDKPRVFAEIRRILKDHGRAVISDIVSEGEVPPRLKVNERLWGECIVGALTEEQFLAMLEQAGFYGLAVLKKTFWKTIEGFRFFSVTVQGWKFDKTQGCVYQGQAAIYRGPFKAALDEEGHLFPRNVAVSICTDTAAKLARGPYAGQFVIVEPDGSVIEAVASCCPGGNGNGAACC
jgi:MoaA/NifB/PqqE/SkfB family radical SAM enzyme/ubiquinone/menaquinone biosynthesis C-methylase UbiE